MKTIKLTNRIDVNTIALETLKNVEKTDLIDLTECTFICSPALKLISEHPKDKLKLSKEIEEFLNISKQ